MHSLAVLFLFLLPLLWYSCHASEDWADACKYAKNPELCQSSLRMLSLESAAENSVLKASASIGSSQASVRKLLSSANTLNSQVSSDGLSSSLKTKAALRDCLELLEDALDLIAESTSAIQNVGASDNYRESHLEDVHTWMSAALTYYTTCIDGLSGLSSETKRFLSDGEKVEKSLSIALSHIVFLRQRQGLKSLDFPKQTPLWLAKTIGNDTVLPNVTVAQDGSGQFNTITAALAAAPTKSKSRFVIYIKQGTYNENFEVPRIQNLTFMGDGIGKTIITGNKSVQDPNVTTFTSATVIIRANDFIAQDITFQNTAGAINHQAVAVRITADKVAFFRCSFEGYQDTLYAHSLRQYFTQCDIYGTIDYIFGNAAATFQNCNLYARLPMAKQKNTYTAQGRTDPNQNTGFAFQSCNIDGVDELKRNITQFPTYLGRPWKEYSVTVFLKCFESSVVNPAGWLEWSGDFALQTLFYGEYFCYGPGGDSANRVDWSTQIYDSTFASQYTAASLIGGTDWLPTTHLPYSLGL